MGNHVYYHHPDNVQYSLTYVTHDRDEISTSDREVIIERCECDEPFFILYTNGVSDGTIDDIDGDFEAVLEEMSAENRTIAVRLLQIFEEIIEEKQTAESEKLKIYKQIEIENVPNAIDRVDWHGSAVDVAGQLMSNLILKHALPNANHRTAISMSQWYLESLQTGFSFPEFATADQEWKEWADEYIVESKRMLTVRRNAKAFWMLSEWGCDIVKRKEDIDIELDEYTLDLSTSEAFEYYGEKHTALCTEFVRESVKLAGHEALLSADGVKKADFVRYLQLEEGS